MALGAVPVRFADPAHAVLFGMWAVLLVLLLATDLDQRLLPDVVTLPMIPVALAIAVVGANPLVPPADLPWAIAAAIAVPAVLGVLAIPFGAGAIGMGDLKLLVSVGILGGALRLITGVIWGAILGGIVILGLLLVRRITLKSYVPFGPFLIYGVLAAIIVR